MNIKLNNKQDPKRCIFCQGDSPLTKEHIYGQWLARNVEIEFSRVKHYTSRLHWGEYEGTPISSVARGKLNRNGKPHNQQLKVVCRFCNNGWMGKIQESAKEILLPMFSGQNTNLSTESILILAQYATMVTMVIEFSDIETIAISQESRSYFKEKLLPPPNLFAYFGLCLSERQIGSFWHRAAYIGDISWNIPKISNTQTTTFYLKNAFFHVLSMPSYLDFPEKYYRDRIGLMQLWPPHEGARLPSLIYTKEGVTRVAKFFWSELGANTEPHFGLIDNPP